MRRGTTSWGSSSYLPLLQSPSTLGARVRRREGSRPGALIVAGLAAGLAAGTKLNFLLPAAVLVLGLALMAPRGERGRALGIGSLAALAGGGYWYLRNLAHSGNPLPWFTDLGSISLPAPDQALGGREAHSVLGYLTDGAVWSDWLLPGLRDGLTLLWPLLLALALAGLLLSLGRSAERSPASCWRRGPCRRPRLADRPDLGLRPRGNAARLRVRPALPGSRSRPRLGPLASRTCIQAMVCSTWIAEPAIGVE